MLAFLLCLLGTAAAGTPVALPPGEPTDAWAQAFALAGLSAGAPGDGTGATIVAEGSSWRIRIRDQAGVAHEVRIPVPTTQQAREDAAWLIASLARPERYQGDPAPAALPRPSLPPAPPRATGERATPSKTSPAATPPSSQAIGAPSPQPAPSPPGPVVSADPTAPSPWIAPEATPAPAAEPATAPDAVGAGPPTASPPPPPPPAPVYAWVRLDARTGWRPATSPGVEIGGSGGAMWGPWEAGASVSGTTAASLLELDGDRGFDEWTLAALGGWAPPGRIAPVVELAAGLDVRRYLQDGEGIAEAAVPTVRATFGVSLDIQDTLAVLPALSAAVDARATDLQTPEGGTTLLSPWSFTAGVSVQLASKNPRDHAIRSGGARHAEGE